MSLTRYSVTNYMKMFTTPRDKKCCKRVGGIGVEGMKGVTLQQYGVREREGVEQRKRGYCCFLSTQVSDNNNETLL